MIDVYVKTIKSDGIQGLYRGFVISCVGIFIYRGMYFGLYDSIKPIVLGDNASVFLSFILGWIVTVTAGLMSYPIDTVRRRMMMTSGQVGYLPVRRFGQWASNNLLNEEFIYPRDFENALFRPPYLVISIR